MFTAEAGPFETPMDCAEERDDLNGRLVAAREYRSWYEGSMELEVVPSRCREGLGTYRCTVAELKRLKNVQKLFRGCTVHEESSTVGRCVLNVEGENNGRK